MLLAGLAGLTVGARDAAAQVLSSPLGPPAAAPAGAPAQKGAPQGLVTGTGPGVHGALSAFAPLPQRSDVLAWSVLTDVKQRIENRRILVSYPPAVLALNQQTQRVQGFMLPLEPGVRHRRFLLSAVPPTCPFCVPGGAESMIEVHTKSPLPYVEDAVVLEGRFHVLQDNPLGLYYRLTEARSVP